MPHRATTPCPGSSPIRNSSATWFGSTWAMDETHTDRPTVGYPYFEMTEPTAFSSENTYVETETKFTQTMTHEWNHGLGDVVTALGMTITGLVEHP